MWISRIYYQLKGGSLCTVYIYIYSFISFGILISCPVFLWPQLSLLFFQFEFAFFRGNEIIVSCGVIFNLFIYIFFEWYFFLMRLTSMQVRGDTIQFSRVGLLIQTQNQYQQLWAYARYSGTAAFPIQTITSFPMQLSIHILAQILLYCSVLIHHCWKEHVCILRIDHKLG